MLFKHLNRRKQEEYEREQKQIYEGYMVEQYLKGMWWFMPSFVYDVNTQKIQPVDEQISWGKIGGTFIASAAGYYT